MNAATIVAVVLVSLSISANASSLRPRGPNCDLVAPPSAAGEEIDHGITFKIYPRAKDINSHYTGCQAILAPTGDKWVVMMLTEVVKGDPVRVWGAEHDPAMDCRYDHGRLVEGEPKQCKGAFPIVRSMAPGCVEKIRKAVEMGASHPKECEYE